jgi:hypothetical protein
MPPLVNCLLLAEQIKSLSPFVQRLKILLEIELGLAPGGIKKLLG